jgi:RNA polymerase sigma factor (sigma-70 family)
LKSSRAAFAYNRAMVRSDEDLLIAAKLGDREALALLLERHAPAVRAGLQIQPRWQSLLDPDDVMQVTYFEAFERIRGFYSPAGAFPRWLARIAQRNLIDALRLLHGKKRGAGRRIDPPRRDDAVDWLDQMLVSDGTTPTRHLSRQEVRDLLDAALERLPTDYGRVLRAVFFDGKSVEQIAADLGRRPGAVYLLRLRGLRRLRECLGSESMFFSSSS